MLQFKKYAKYYDLIYRDKAYNREASVIFKILKRYSTSPVKNILSMGCGTGTYERILAEKNVEILGIDTSVQMLSIAKKKIPPELSIRFRAGDVRTFRTKEKFDAVIAMFNIVGYQKTNQDFNNFIKTANAHLKKHGLFVFDAWYKGAVLYDPPTDRIKVINLDKTRKIIRKTLQKLDLKRNILNLTFRIQELKNKKVLQSFKEKHLVRFFRLEEVQKELKKHGFHIIKISSFPSSSKKIRLKNITKKNWDMLIIARKN